MYVSELMGKATIDTNTYGRSFGRNGNYSKNDQNAGRELMLPEEVRMLDNRYALLFIRGERPVKDLKYEILRHPNVALTADGQADPYVHGDMSEAVNTIALTFDTVASEEMTVLPETGYELLSEEDVEKEIASREKEEKTINGEQK